jgi:hypothetical protein
MTAAPISLAAQAEACELAAQYLHDHAPIKDFDAKEGADLMAAAATLRGLAEQPPAPDELVRRLRATKWLDAGERNPVTGPMRLLDPGLYERVCDALAARAHKPVGSEVQRWADILRTVSAQNIVSLMNGNDCDQIADLLERQQRALEEAQELAYSGAGSDSAIPYRDLVRKYLDERDALAAKLAEVERAMHASAPAKHLCADCTMDKEPCPTCYKAWWQRRHPNTTQIDAEPAEGEKETK